MKKLIFKLVSFTAVASTIVSPVMAASYNNTSCNINNNTCYTGTPKSCYTIIDENSPEEYFTYEYASQNWQVYTTAGGQSYIVTQNNKGGTRYDVPTKCYSYCYNHGRYDTCTGKEGTTCTTAGCTTPNCNGSNCTTSGCNTSNNCGNTNGGNNGSGSSNGGNSSESTVEVSAFEEKVVELVNIEREKAGLSPLKINTKLTELARIKSQDMLDDNYFSHNSPTLGSAFDMMKAKGVKYNTAGENIAMGQTTPEAVVTAWMNSASHRANILKSSYTEIGVGYVAKGNYWTQMFIG